jgi:FkbM family methyltransferase
VTETRPTFDAVSRHLLDQIPERLLCVDVGARWGVDPVLGSLGDHASILCFEPDREECARLQAETEAGGGSAVEYVPVALSSDGRELELHVTSEPACSSIYPPDPVLVERYPGLAPIIRPEELVRLPSVTLDAHLDEVGLGSPDLLKLDTQGSELDILRGATRRLGAATMLDIEVEFNTLYRGQALFGDVDVFLRAMGFALWRLPLLAHYPVGAWSPAATPVHVSADPPGRAQSADPGNGQLFWAQAHYVNRRLLDYDEAPLDPVGARKGAVIAGAYGYWDLALMALRKCGATAPEAAELERLLPTP